MDLSNYSISELVNLYSQSIKELKKRGVLRTNNVIGEIGEYLVLEEYERNPDLPKLNAVPLGTKNINAISQAGERYSIKSTTGNVTGVIYGLQPPGSTIADKPLFEYMVICKLDSDCSLEGIYQITWDGFIKHRKWHSRMNAWNVAVTKSLRKDSFVVYQKGSEEEEKKPDPDNGNPDDDQDDNDDSDDNDDPDDDDDQDDNDDPDDDDDPDDTDEKAPVAITWNKTKKANHGAIREAAADKIGRAIKCRFKKTSPSRYVSDDNECALFVLSATYSQKNSEYWYSIDDENIPWMKLYPTCYVVFALGSADHLLVFEFGKLRQMLDGCLKTREDPEKKKKAHFHIAFSVEESRVYFKKKRPEREFIEVTEYLK